MQTPEIIGAQHDVDIEDQKMGASFSPTGTFSGGLFEEFTVFFRQI
jgi:hypothetical protein